MAFLKSSGETRTTKGYGFGYRTVRRLRRWNEFFRSRVSGGGGLFLLPPQQRGIERRSISSLDLDDSEPPKTNSIPVKPVTLMGDESGAGSPALELSLFEGLYHMGSFVLASFVHTSQTNVSPYY